MLGTLARFGRGIAGAVRSHPRVFALVAAGVLALDLFLPPVLLSIVRKPFDYFTFNAWLPQLPGYVLRHDISIQQKLVFIPNLALFWFSADSPFGGVEWGFAVTVGDMLRFIALSLLLGLYFALVFYCRDLSSASSGWSWRQGGGASGALASVLGISTGGCTVVGCGAPVIPVLGLAFVGLSSGTLAVMAGVARLATPLVFSAVALGVAYLGWVAGGRSRSEGPESLAPRPRRAR